MSSAGKVESTPSYRPTSNVSVSRRTAPMTTPRENYYLPTSVSARFGVRLRELRRERSLTQVGMANRFGIDRTYISDVERGRKSISLQTLEVIALGMRVSLSDLLQNL